MFRFGDRGTRMNWVHVHNLVQAHVLAAEALTAARGYVAVSPLPAPPPPSAYRAALVLMATPCCGSQCGGHHILSVVHTLLHLICTTAQEGEPIAIVPFLR